MRGRIASIALGLALGLALVSARASAQAGTLTLNISSAGVAFGVPTAADYMAGYIDNPNVLALDGRIRGPANGTQYTGHIELCALASDLGNGKPLGDLLWRPSDLSLPFQSIQQTCTGATGSNRIIGSYPLLGGQNDRRFASGVIFRLVLRWTDIASSYGVGLGFTAITTSP